MTLREYFAHYEMAHQHKANKVSHVIGIPAIITALGLLLFTDYKVEGWLLFSLGWVFQFIGHAVERYWPEFMRNPIYLIIGPLYFGHKVIKKFSGHEFLK